MEGIGAEVSQKIRSAIKAKLMEIGVYVDEELPDYVMVMVANKRSKDQMDDDLQLFLGKHTSLFTTWLHQVLQKLQEVTVANLGGTKRKLLEDSKKKKKTKQDSEKRDLKKKIKVEPEDDNKKELCSKKNEDDKGKKVSPSTDICCAISSRQLDEVTGPKVKEKNDLKTSVEQVQDSKIVSKTNEEIEYNYTVNNYNRQKSEDRHRGTRSKSHSTSSHTEDLDDEDCINIRTDGELLDTAEEVNTEEPTKKLSKKKDSPIFKDNDKASEDIQTSLRQSQVTKNTLKPEDENINKPSKTETTKKESVPQESPPSSNEKIVDARDLLNRKKAAKISDNRARDHSRDRSVSPQRKRKDGDRDSTVRIYRDDRDTNRRTGKDDERKSCSRKVSRDDDRDRRNTRDRDFHSSKRRGEDRTSRRSDINRIDCRENRRRDLSNESQSKRLKLEKPIRNKNDDWDLAGSSKMVSVVESRKVEIESSVKRNDLEELHKRGGLVSRVVPRPLESEDNMETPVPSMVKATPRPRRPPSQQPSSNLIIKAISEANKSLANMANQRPDSTQRERRDPVFARTLRQLERIPPEKIAVSITNSLALQNESPELNDESDGHRSPAYDESAINRSPPSNLMEVTSPEPDNCACTLNEINANEEWNKGEKMEEENHPQEVQEHEPEPSAELRYEEPMQETGDPQFVVTLNGYDSDGLYSQNVLDLGDEGDSDDWLKINADEEPLLTSTPDEVESPRPNRDNTTPPIVMNTPAVNHSNLIEVELVQMKTTERCKYWPACRLADKCTYYHPSKPCKIFPNCKFGDACLYIHPQCKYNALCTRKDCVFAHTPAYTPLQPAAVPKIKTLYAASAPLPCKFYPNCANINCQFTHPPRACRFGLYCTKKDCVFHHGQVPPVDKLKWTRVQAT